MHLGLIGGIGPAATVAYYERLSPTFSGGAHALTVVQADMETLVANAVAQDAAAQAETYLPLLQRLERAGAEVAAITSITGHFCFDELRAISPLPLASIFEALNAALAERGLARLGVLGAGGVMASRVYGRLTVEVLIPGDDLDALGALYFQLARSGVCTPEERARFFDAGRALMDQGAEAVLLGGADLGLAFSGHDPGFPVLDAVEIHCHALERVAAFGDNF
ncbi:MAG: aspartate/glutamate racemase family protein [Rhodobacteraceae bacterium]|nr:aspartate/glutamate racemase family protein [Paracoccaceae bacterium]